jgi:hypothetical protein
MNRRRWLGSAAGLSLAALLSAGCSRRQRPVILLVSGWQRVNIGDVAHTPGMLQLLSTYLPEAEVVLWPKDLGCEEERLLLRSFPKLRIVRGEPGDLDHPACDAVRKAIAGATLLLHGSGPGAVGLPMIREWMARTSRPFGFLGVTIGEVGEELKDVLQQARFIFTRETASLDVLRRAGIRDPEMGFAPDATFVLGIQDEASAARYMELHKLEEGRFICVVPRLRYTPYHRIHSYNLWDAAKIAQVTADNLRHAEADHAVLRFAMERWIGATGHPVVLCPEMGYQTELYEPYLYNPLPDSLKPKVLMHPYWLPDAAASLYRKAFAVLSMECHSPIIALANGRPAFYLRQPSDTIKGQMYYDLGLGDWVFEMDDTKGEAVADRLFEVYNAPARAETVLNEMNRRVRECYAGSLPFVQNLLHAK